MKYLKYLKYLFLLFFTTVSLVADYIPKKETLQIISKQTYTSYYDKFLKGPVMVSYDINGSLVNVKNIKTRPSFHSEKELDKKYRAYTSDYTNSGYDRGHLAPDAVFDYNKTILKEVYSMINVVPQKPDLNRRSWRYLEEENLKISIKNGIVHIKVFIFYPDLKDLIRIGRRHVAIPKAFLKKVNYCNNNKCISKCYLYKNTKEKNTLKPENYLISDEECMSLIITH